MPSIIPGFEYDIFISYRQKDNKHDGWVTTFVEELKGELEATFKEDISIYFDENPGDGLLETHSVDKSLEGKLRCLIFIPIISRTYCDSKSYAWQHEFCAFNKSAKEDRFGRDIRLGSGNVASRILPVQIHDLDAEDKKLVENELSGFIRGIEFIYKETGVNRPLRSIEDHPDNNLNKTYYRNQINKVALAIREIINAIKQFNPENEEVSQEAAKPMSSPRKNHKTTIIAGLVIALVLTVLGFLFVPKLFKPEEELEKSIAVLPFRTDSREEENIAFINGLMEKLLNNLQMIEDLRVISRQSVEQFRNTTKSIPEIAKELGVNYIIEGSGQKYGNTFSLTVQLIKAVKKEDHIWGKSYEQEIKEVNDIIKIQNQNAETIAEELQAVITPDEQQLIEKIPTTNLTAYDFYQRGQEEYLKYSLDITNRKALEKAEEFYFKALQNDSTYALAYTGLARIYFGKRYAEEYYSTNFLDSCLILINKALTFNNSIAEAYFLKAQCHWQLGEIESVLNELDNALKYNPNYWEVYEFKGTHYYTWNYHKHDYIKAIENLKKAISLNGREKQPELYRELSGTIGGNAGFYELSDYYLKEALKIDNDSAEYYYSLGGIKLRQIKYKEAIEYYKKSLAIDSISRNDAFNLAYTYTWAGRVVNDLAGALAYYGEFKESLKYYNKYIDIISETKTLSIGSYHRIGYSYWMNGDIKEGYNWFHEQKKDCEESIKYNRWYASIGLATYYDLAGVQAFLGDKGKAYENLKVFSKISVCPFWFLSLIKNDPLFDSIRNEPEFQDIVSSLEVKYKAEHERVKKWLEENNML